ncbi:hypothetical protein R6Q59_029346 [Mikania micrantha]
MNGMRIFVLLASSRVKTFERKYKLKSSTLEVTKPGFFGTGSGQQSQEPVPIPGFDRFQPVFCRFRFGFDQFKGGTGSGSNFSENPEQPVPTGSGTTGSGSGSGYVGHL